MPGPMGPRPAPTRRAIDLIALAVSSPPACAKTVVMTDMGSSLVARGGRAAEIDGCKRFEDECLQRRDQGDLQEEEGESERRGEDAERREAEQHDHAARHEEDQQVAGEQV